MLDEKARLVNVGGQLGSHTIQSAEFTAAGNQFVFLAFATVLPPQVSCLSSVNTAGRRVAETGRSTPTDFHVTMGFSTFPMSHATLYSNKDCTMAVTQLSYVELIPPGDPRPHYWPYQ